MGVYLKCYSGFILLKLKLKNTKWGGIEVYLKCYSGFYLVKIKVKNTKWR
jgi:hypothetical protein